MARRYRKKPLAQFEHGTRIYAPSDGESRYRVVATDPASGETDLRQGRDRGAGAGEGARVRAARRARGADP